MKTFTIASGERRKCRIVCRKNALGALGRAVGGRQAFIFTDETVLRLYGKAIARALPGTPVYAMPAGEENKTPQTLFALLGEMAKAQLRRTAVLVAVGGGVVGDVGGLAASLYMRGISCIQVPTTLLAQADSAVGGKTAVDFCGVKNLVGAFYPPELVLADGAFLRTLPPREIRCGLGEIVKHGALDGALFGRLCAAPDLTDVRFLAGIVPENIAVKADVVRRDPSERGLRRCLNLGHTTAHAIELSGGALSHGECVLWGLIFESRLAERHADADAHFCEKLRALCFSVLGERELPPFNAALARLDKKNTEADTVTVTAPAGIGTYRILELPFAQYERELGEIGEELC